jgi:hypothetical protein
MNIPEQDIENLLRRAPAPTPPAGLAERLRAAVDLAPGRNGAHGARVSPRPESWLRRWWPALAPAAISLACGMVLTVQEGQIRDTQQTIRTLSQAVAKVRGNPAEAAVRDSAPADPAAAEQREIARLRELAAKLSAEATELERLRAENQSLRSQLAAPRGSRLGPEEDLAMREAQEKALMWKCSNNLKQLGLAVKVWALDNDGKYSPDVVSMSNEISAPLTLICPADTSRHAASDFFHFSSANCSYEYLGAGLGDPDGPNFVVFRCPIHGSVTLSDGSVQMGVGKTHPEDLVYVNGRLCLRQHGTEANTTGPQAATEGPSSNP